MAWITKVIRHCILLLYMVRTFISIKDMKYQSLEKDYTTLPNNLFLKEMKIYQSFLLKAEQTSMLKMMIKPHPFIRLLQMVWTLPKLNWNKIKELMKFQFFTLKAIPKLLSYWSKMARIWTSKLDSGRIRHWCWREKTVWWGIFWKEYCRMSTKK